MVTEINTGGYRVPAIRHSSFRPSDVVLHVDVTDAYPSVDRGLMLNEVYGAKEMK
jgi:hypothetical protein